MVNIPENVTVKVSGNMISVKGPNGELEKPFTPLVAVDVSGNEVKVEGEKSYVNTVSSLVSNMISGVTEGFKKELKVVYAHFPVSIEVKGKDILIKNFQGEKQPRRASVVGNTKVTAKGQDITVSGPDKEAVGQTVANMRAATRIKDKDSRIFQDGIYKVEG